MFYEYLCLQMVILTIRYHQCRRGVRFPAVEARSNSEDDKDFFLLYFHILPFFKEKRVLEDNLLDQMLLCFCSVIVTCCYVHEILCSFQLLIFMVLETAKALNICIKKLFASLKEHKLKFMVN